MSSQKHNVACCLMHNRNEAIYQNFLEDMVADMKECVAIAHKAGVPDDKIMLDPGVGFGKTYEQNLEAINHVDVLQELGLPILLGTSRKSVIGNTLDLPVDQRVEGTLATTVIGMAPRMLLCPGTRYQRKPPDHSDDESDPVLLGGNLWIK